MAEPAVQSLSRRLAALGGQSAVYGLGSVVSRFASLILITIYVHYLTRAELGAVQNVVALVAVGATIAQLGMVNALFRFALERTGDGRWAVVRTAIAFCAVSGAIAALIGAAFAEQGAAWLLGGRTSLWLVGCAGLWISIVYEPSVGLYRVEQRPARFLMITVVNVAVTVVASVAAVAVLRLGATGLLAGSYAGTAVALCVLAVDRRVELRGALDRAVLGPMLRFGLPFMPSRLALWGIGFATGLLLTLLGSLALAGVYSVSYRVAQVVALAVTAFQLAWPAFAYSIQDDAEARRVYRAVLTYWTVLSVWLVLGLALVRVAIMELISERYVAAANPMALIALGIAFYGSYYVVGVAVGRVKRTQFNWVVTGVAALTSIALCVVLIPSYGATGAAVATAVAYAAMAALMTWRAEHVFPVGYEWMRILLALGVAAGLFVVGDRLLPETGPEAVLARLAIALAYPLALLLAGFFRPEERRRLRLLMGRALSV
jgi:O-antigen/teichoic acid export membrane protein